MERASDHGDLAAALAEARPAPRTAFIEELDARAAASFPRRPRARRSPLASLAERVRPLSSRRALFAGGSVALAAIAVATVLVVSSDSGSRPVAPRPDFAGRAPGAPETRHSNSIPRQDGSKSSSAPSAGAGSPEINSLSAGDLATLAPSDAQGLHPRGYLKRNRDVERSAEISLLAAPDDVASDSAQVFSAVHDADGIVLRSTTRAGRQAGARFDLLVPSARLGDALAAFSAIDQVRSRHEATADITAPTVTVSERLRDSRAKIDGLLSQLSAAETEAESTAIESELRSERRHAARLRSQLDGLNQRTEFSRVSLKIETSPAEAGSGNTWGIDDAFGDAGHILGVAAGVILVALAVIGPIALVFLLAWLAHRLWLRTRRERALDP
jgi:uncharacterized protein DUF4349